MLYKFCEKFSETMIVNIIFSVSVFLLLANVLSTSNFFHKSAVKTYVETVKNMIQIIIIFAVVILIIYAVVGFWGKRYSLRVDNFNIGGINVFFDKSSEIFVKAVGGFIASKRTLFKFNKERDNISEVLDSYYATYKFIMENLELLDSEKDEELYTTAVSILQKLNNFLTKHQNDYRRWYVKIMREDIIKVSEHEEDIIVHQTTIEVVQECYYRYEELQEDFKALNKFFIESDIRKTLKINSYEWRID